MLEEFATKGDGEFGGLTEAFAESRESLIDRSMDNFRQYPIAGIGFGVPSDTSQELFEVKRVGGIPISASVEKGSLPSATLEETGIIGAGLCLVSRRRSLLHGLRGGLHSCLDCSDGDSAECRRGDALFYGGVRAFRMDDDCMDGNACRFRREGQTPTEKPV